jgi:hypothetical protein
MKIIPIFQVFPNAIWLMKITLYKLHRITSLNNYTWCCEIKTGPWLWILSSANSWLFQDHQLTSNLIILVDLHFIVKTKILFLIKETLLLGLAGLPFLKSDNTFVLICLPQSQENCIIYIGWWVGTKIFSSIVDLYLWSGELQMLVEWRSLLAFTK